MRGFLGFTKRNLLLYFKDFQAVVFSLLTSIIVFVLYLLFLKGTFVDSISSAMHGLVADGLKEETNMLVNEILLTGILGSALITVPYNCLQTIVRDKEQRIDYDISATPLKRWQIVISYFFASSVSATVMSGLIMTIGLVILRCMGDMHMPAKDVVLLGLVIALGAVSATAFFMLVILFFKSSAASGAFFGIISAASGFVIGAYIPIAQFSEGVQTVCNLFPASHVTILIRNLLLNNTLEQIDTSLHGMDRGMVVSKIKENFMFQAHLFGKDMDISQMVLYVFAGVVICVIGMVFVYKKTYRRK